MQHEFTPWVNCTEKPIANTVYCITWLPRDGHLNECWPSLIRTSPNNQLHIKHLYPQLFLKIPSPLSKRCTINSDLFLFGFFFYMVMKGIAQCGYVIIYFCCCLTSKIWVFAFNRFLQETVTGTPSSNMTSPGHSALSMFVFTPNSGTVGSLWELRFMAVMVRAMFLEPYLSFVLVKTVFAYQKKGRHFPLTCTSNSFQNENLELAVNASCT